MCVCVYKMSQILFFFIFLYFSYLFCPQKKSGSPIWFVVCVSPIRSALAIAIRFYGAAKRAAYVLLYTGVRFYDLGSFSQPNKQEATRIYRMYSTGYKLLVKNLLYTVEK